ncbi:hypothetical protein BURMUCF1_1846 [Burkholderia multivorans ATCC BAA-247]|nr:hypothetical protein BURMUCF1_1846 [Burkholderia multivorans ATCC BAA-247]
MDPRDSRGFFYACHVWRYGATEGSSFVWAYPVVAIVRHDGEARASCCIACLAM